MTTTNRFLTTSNNNHDVASEKTLSDIDDILRNGTITTVPSGTQDVNIEQLNGNPIDLGAGNISTSTQRICIGNDQNEVKSNITQLNSNTIDLGSGIISSGTIRCAVATDSIVECKTGLNNFNVISNLNQVGGTAVSVSTGNSDLGCQRVSIISDQPEVKTNLNQINSVGIATNNGTSSGGTQRVNICSDNTPFLVNLGVGGVSVATNSGNSSNETQRVVIVSDQVAVPVNPSPSTSNTIFSTVLKDSTTGLIHNIVADYSGASSEDFIYTASSTTYINTMNVFIRDTTSFNLDEYGTLTALTNGIKYFYNLGAGKVYLNDDVPAKIAEHWVSLSGNPSDFSSYGSPDNSLTVHLCFSQIFGTPLILENTDIFGVELDDNFTGLTEHYFVIAGYT